VSTEEDEQAGTVQGAGEPEPCMPCRGTGQVISHLGGPAQSIGCPWCDGSGVRRPGVDAQQHWLDDSRFESSPGGDGGEAA
jgi:DnaJ-class molecular chaperone